MSARITTTQWSQVLAARDGSDTEAQKALETLCEAYWEPLYGYIRCRGSDREEARDLTQAFFAELLDKDLLAAVDPAKGRFRSFLLTSLQHFLSHVREKAAAQKRGGTSEIVPLDVEGAERRYGLQSKDMTPAEMFEYRWAVTMLDRAMDRLRIHSMESGSEAQFEILKQYLTGLEADVPYRRAAESLGMSEGAVKTAVYRLRRRFGECLRGEVAETVADPAEVDAEVRQLLETVRG